MIKTSFRIFDGSKCSIPGKCSIVFDANSTFQYFPSNTHHYLLTLSGSLTFNYYNGSNVVSSEIYSSNAWTDYQEEWQYENPFIAYVNSNTIFACINISNSSLTKADCTLKTKRIENESFSFSTDKESVLFVYGANYSYNGNQHSANTRVSAYVNETGNIATHTITASTPVSLMYLEKI
jgi:hypothetical protein